MALCRPKEVPLRRLILCDLIDMTFSQKLEHVDRDHIDGLWEDLTTMGQHKRSLGADGVFAHPDCGSGYVNPHIC